jgi:uncharacterized repeat protein (TIGR01451 family)
MVGGVTGAGGLGSVGRATTTVLTLAVLAGAPAAVRGADDVPLPAGSPGVSLHTDVFEVERVLDAGGRVERRLVPALELVAGDELRYAILVRNDTGTRFDAGRVQVQTAVPPDTQFLPGSAGGPGALVEYSLADGDFSENLPELTDDDGDPPAAADRPEIAEVAAPDPVAEIPNEPAGEVSAPQEAAEADTAAETDDATGSEDAADNETVADNATLADNETAAEDPSLLTIRWTYQRPLEPGAEAELFFHVRLE